MSEHDDKTFAYGQHWTPPTDDEDPQPQGQCDDPNGCPPATDNG